MQGPNGNYKNLNKDLNVKLQGSNNFLEFWIFFYRKTCGIGPQSHGPGSRFNGRLAHEYHKTRVVHLMMEGLDAPGEGV
jgi:hypothetical protein